MREIIARIVCGVMVSVVVALAVLFAWRHNPRAPGGPGHGTPVVAISDELREKAARGRQVYADQNCAACHSLAGAGNPRHPLDRIGARHPPAELRAWITATGEAERKLPDAVVRRKRTYRELTDDELEALAAYLLIASGTP